MNDKQRIEAAEASIQELEDQLAELWRIVDPYGTHREVGRSLPELVAFLQNREDAYLKESPYTLWGAMKRLAERIAPNESRAPAIADKAIKEFDRADADRAHVRRLQKALGMGDRATMTEDAVNAAIARIDGGDRAYVERSVALRELCDIANALGVPMEPEYRDCQIPKGRALALVKEWLSNRPTVVPTTATSDQVHAAIAENSALQKNLATLGAAMNRIRERVRVDETATADRVADIVLENIDMLEKVARESMDELMDISKLLDRDRKRPLACHPREALNRVKAMASEFDKTAAALEKAGMSGKLLHEMAESLVRVLHTLRDDADRVVVKLEELSQERALIIAQLNRMGYVLAETSPQSCVQDLVDRRLEWLAGEMGHVQQLKLDNDRALTAYATLLEGAKALAHANEKLLGLASFVYDRGEG